MAQTKTTVQERSHGGPLATALMGLAMLALLLLMILGVLFYLSYSSDQAAKKAGTTVEVQAPAGTTVDPGTAGAGTGAGGTGSGSGNAGNAQGGQGGAGGAAAPANSDTIRINVPNVTVPNL
jgi:hypothetical protein